MRMGLWRLVLLAALGFGVVTGGAAVSAQEAHQAQAPDLAILIVGDEANTTMLRDEKTLISEMTRLLTGKGEVEANRERFAHVRDLQVYSYHFNQAREKQYCEKKLNILGEDLLFVGLVELKDRLPRRVVYRLDRIVTARRSAVDILSRAEEMLAPPATQASAEPEPEASPSPSASAAPAAPASPGTRPAAPPVAPPVTRPAAPPVTAVAPPVTPPAAPVQPAVASSTWRIQVGSFAELNNAQELVAQLKDKGHESRIEHSSRKGGNLFRVYLGSFGDRQAAQAALDRLKKDGFDKAFLVAPEGA